MSGDEGKRQRRGESGPLGRTELGPAARMSSACEHLGDSLAQAASFLRSPPDRASPPRQCTSGDLDAHGHTNGVSSSNSHLKANGALPLDGALRGGKSM